MNNIESHHNGEQLRHDQLTNPSDLTEQQALSAIEELEPITITEQEKNLLRELTSYALSLTEWDITTLGKVGDDTPVDLTEKKAKILHIQQLLSDQGNLTIYESELPTVRLIISQAKEYIARWTEVLATVWDPPRPERKKQLAGIEQFEENHLSS